MFKHLTVMALMQVSCIQQAGATTLCMKSEASNERIERVQVVLPEYKSRIGSIKFESKARESIIVFHSSKKQGKNNAPPMEVLTEFFVFHNGEKSGVLLLATAGSSLGELIYKDMGNPKDVHIFHDDSESQGIANCDWSQ